MSERKHKLPNAALSVRRYRLEDESAFYNATDANREHMSLLGITAEFPSRKDATDLFMSNPSRIVDIPTHYGAWIDNTFAGNVFFKLINPESLPQNLDENIQKILNTPNTWELNYWRDKRLPSTPGPAATENYMDTAIKTAIKMFMESQENTANVIAIVEQSNTPSHRLLHRLGQTALQGLHPHYSAPQLLGSYYLINL